MKWFRKVSVMQENDAPLRTRRGLRWKLTLAYLLVTLAVTVVIQALGGALVLAIF